MRPGLAQARALRRLDTLARKHVDAEVAVFAWRNSLQPGDDRIGDL